MTLQEIFDKALENMLVSLDDQLQIDLEEWLNDNNSI